MYHVSTTLHCPFATFTTFIGICNPDAPNIRIFNPVTSIHMSKLLKKSPNDQTTNLPNNQTTNLPNNQLMSKLLNS